MNSRSVDLLVAGGGPAGLVTALHAARAGLEVEVWEPRPGVVDKACGEGLMPGALQSLQDLGVDPPGHAFRGVRYVGGRRSTQSDFAHGPGRGIRRTTLHAALLDAALAAGARVEYRPVRELRQDDQHVVADGVRARHLVAADGLHSPLRRSLGLDVPLTRHPRFGLRRHFRTAPWSAYVEVHWGREVEAYVTPVADDVVGVAVLASSKGSFDERLRALPELHALLADGEPASDVRGAGPLRQRARQRVAGRVLLVGDAAGYVDALTGEGLALAFAQAGAAVTAITDGVPGRYERDWRVLTRRYRWLTTALLVGTRPVATRRAIVPAAALLSPVFGAAVDALARPVGRP
ncbi:MAG: FAD-dependent monooxygenase [Nocardioides sp.]|nr:FAD-dependent monooxygenase [Nocardioides sp.]